MKETIIDIPHFRRLQLRHLVLDYNGTIARDGTLLDAVRPLLGALAERYAVHVITADTFGTVAAELEGLGVTVRVLCSDDHTAEKAAYLAGLGAETCAAVGNGSNDAQMLETAALGIALLGDEGCSTQTLLRSDVVCRCIEEALELLLSDKRLIATLRA